MKKKINSSLILFVLGLNLSLAQGVFGRWKTVDDQSGEARAIVHVYEENGSMYAVIEKLLDKGRENAVCEKCEGVKKDQPIVGMKIMEGLKESSDGEWKGKTLLDPETGTVYRCKVWLNPENRDELKVRGYVAFLYRTQTWHRLKE